MSVCAIILNYFDENGTIKCIESLGISKLDLIVIVDNSGDVDAANKLTLRVNDFLKLNPDKKIRLFINKNNIGFSAGINKAVKTIEKESLFGYYFFINNDAIASAEVVNRLLYELENDSNLTMAAPLIRHMNDLQGYLYYQPVTGLVFRTKKPWTISFLSGCCLMLRRSDFHGYILDEEFFMYGEDIELCWRVARNGKKIKLCSDIYVDHKGSSSSNKCSFFYEYHVLKGHFVLSRKVLKKAGRFLSFFIKPIILFARMVRRIVICRSINPVKAYCAQLRG